MQEQKVVNLPTAPLDLIGKSQRKYKPKKLTPKYDVKASMDSFLEIGNKGTDFSVVPTKDIPFDGNLYYPGRDNKKMQEIADSTNRNSLLKQIAATIVILILLFTIVYAFKVNRLREVKVRSKSNSILNEIQVVKANKRKIMNNKESDEIIAELERLQALLEKGAITNDEFNIIKKRTLD